MGIKVGIWLIASIISAILYRLGGIGKPFDTKYRDVGVSLVTIAYMLILGLRAPWWAYLACFGLSWGALASYWGLDSKKWGFWAHGLGLSLAVLPIAFVTGHWLGFAIRTIVLTALISVWSEYTSKDWVEEGGRGFLIAATLPLLLI